jgi:ribonuclease HI
VKLAEHNRIELVWVLGHLGIDGSETADQLASQVSAIPLPDLNLPLAYLQRLIRD